MYFHKWAHLQNPKSENGLKESPGFSAENSEMIMDSILSLDDSYRSGSLQKNVYLRRRAELKSRLEGILKGEPDIKR